MPFIMERKELYPTVISMLVTVGYVDKAKVN